MYHIFANIPIVKGGEVLHFDAPSKNGRDKYIAPFYVGVGSMDMDGVHDGYYSDDVFYFDTFQDSRQFFDKLKHKRTITGREYVTMGDLWSGLYEKAQAERRADDYDTKSREKVTYLSWGVVPSRYWGTKTRDNIHFEEIDWIRDEKLAEGGEITEKEWEEKYKEYLDWHPDKESAVDFDTYKRVQTDVQKLQEKYPHLAEGGKVDGKITELDYYAGISLASLLIDRGMFEDEAYVVDDSYQMAEELMNKDLGKVDLKKINATYTPRSFFAENAVIGTIQGGLHPTAEQIADKIEALVNKMLEKRSEMMAEGGEIYKYTYRVDGIDEEGNFVVQSIVKTREEAEKRKKKYQKRSDVEEAKIIPFHVKERKDEGGEIERMRMEYAKEDVELLEKEGDMAIANTTYGTLFGDYRDGVFEFNTSDFKNQFRGNKEDAIVFLSQAYTVEHAREGGSIWTDEQIKKVKELDKEYYDELEEKDIYVTSKEASDIWKEKYKARMRDIFKEEFAEGGDIEVGYRPPTTEEIEVIKEKERALATRGGASEKEIEKIGELRDRIEHLKAWADLGEDGKPKHYKTVRMSAEEGAYEIRNPDLTRHYYLYSRAKEYEKELNEILDKYKNGMNDSMADGGNVEGYGDEAYAVMYRDMNTGDYNLVIAKTQPEIDRLHTIINSIERVQEDKSLSAEQADFEAQDLWSTVSDIDYDIKEIEFRDIEEDYEANRRWYKNIEIINETPVPELYKYGGWIKK